MTYVTYRPSMCLEILSEIMKDLSELIVSGQRFEPLASPKYEEGMFVTTLRGLIE